MFEFPASLSFSELHSVQNSKDDTDTTTVTNRQQTIPIPLPPIWLWFPTGWTMAEMWQPCHAMSVFNELKCSCTVAKAAAYRNGPLKDLKRCDFNELI